MSVQDIIQVIRTWKRVYNTLSEESFIQYVLLFENKGSVMGSSNPHPHGQVWATEHIPEEPDKEFRQMTQHYKENHSCLLCDYVKEEMEKKSRIVQ